MSGIRYRVTRWPALRVLLLTILAAVAPTAWAQEQLPPTRITAPRVTPAPEPEPPEAPMPPPVQPFLNPAEQPGRTASVGNGFLAPPSASAGFFTQAEILNFPLPRTTSFLELIPGLIVTQHSSTLKANQYFLRGFSLDHGTDFAGFVDDIPYNLPTNGHGQGYLDLNSVIPELVERVDFGKGPYYTQVGDFSSAGYTNIHYFDQLPYGFFKAEAGRKDWFREVIANSECVGPGVLLYGIESTYYDGPYQVRAHDGRISAVFRYTVGDHEDGARLSAYVYNGSGNANDQIPQRAVWRNEISSLGNLDPSDFITTQRYTLNGQWWHEWAPGSVTRANAYAYYYSLSLFSNFTFFLEDPVHGDQINQLDRRWVTGCNLAHTWLSPLAGDRMQHTVGLQLRNDSIPHVALHHTENRVLVNVITDDAVNEFSTGIYYQNQLQWSSKVRTVLGARGDFYFFDVNDAYVPQNTGDAFARRFSPKGSLILGPWYRTNFFLNGGYSFHSNDARGVLAVLSPSFLGPQTLTAVDRAPGLVPSRGSEIGFRSQAIPGLTTEAALWQLNLAQELVFVGDAGTTEPNRASRRNGIEWSNTYQVCNWLFLNADYSWSFGRLEGEAPEDAPGDRIPQMVTTVFSGGPRINLASGWFSDLRFRYIGPRPLIEDNSVASKPVHLFDLSMGYQCKRYTAGLELLNLFNSNGRDIEYFYSSAIPSDPNFNAGVNDIHFKQLEPFAARFYFNLRW